MGGSIFSGLSPENLRTAIEAAKRSPAALGALAIIAVAVVAALAFAGAMTAHHLGGFHARIEEEDALLRQEEEREAREAAQAAQASQVPQTPQSSPESEEPSERNSP